MSKAYSGSVATAREYYNSEDADQFYAAIWGGEDIHIGLYQSVEESISAASQRTVARMADELALSGSCRLLDIGSGYGGAARYLAENYDCRVTALNLSEKENDRARSLNRERGLDGKITVIDGSFEDIPADRAEFDAVWSQDAMLHSGSRGSVIREVARVLRPGGQFIFTDPMQADDCPPGVLQPILERIHLSSLGSPAFYRSACREAGLQQRDFEDLTSHLVTHYSRVLQETERHQSMLSQRVGSEYLERMKIGLCHWIEGGRNGHLIWGIFMFTRDS